MRLDRMVAREVLERLQPLGVEAALNAMKTQGAEQSEKMRQLQRSLEQAQYEANRAYRQYDAVDPDNRHVVGELERRWNERIQAARAIEREIEGLTSSPSPGLSAGDRKALLKLQQTLLWIYFARPDEMAPGQQTFRCVTLNVMHRRIANGYEPKYCLSGLMLRGVKGAETIGIPSVCVPFIAIRSTQTSGEFHRPKFAEVNDRLSRLGAESYVLLGDTEEKDGPLFQFCNRVFAELMPLFSVGAILRTIRPDAVEAAVVRNPKAKKDYFDAWKAAVEATLASQLME